MSLFLKECKAVLKSVSFLIYVFFLCAFFYMVYIGYIHMDKYKPPRDEDISSLMESFRAGETSITPENHPYGISYTVPKDEKTITNGIYALFSEYLANNYIINYGEERISLSSKKQERIYNILLELCGEDIMEEVIKNPNALEDTMIEIAEGYWTQSSILRELLNTSEFDVSLDDFCRMMIKAGSIIGGDNHYMHPLEYFQSVKIAETYEEALAVYNAEIVDKLLTQDGVSGGMSRLFADRMAIISLLLGGIIAAFYLLRDRTSDEVFASKSISSVRLFMTKYAAVNAVLLLPVLILAVAAAIHAGILAAEFSAPRFDAFAFFKTSFLWVLPTNMFITALSMLITIVTNVPAAPVLLAPVWFIQTTTRPLVGSYGFQRILIRFATEYNSELSLDLYRIFRNDIIINRLFYTALSIIIVCIAAWLYHLKRGGKRNAKNIFRGLQKKH